MIRSIFSAVADMIFVVLFCAMFPELIWWKWVVLYFFVRVIIWKTIFDVKALEEK